MDYGKLNGANTPLKAKIAQRKLHDTKTNATFEALEQRELIERRYSHADRDGDKVFGEPLLAVQITRQGRQLVRQSLGGLHSQRRKPGALTRSQQRYVDVIVAAGLAPRESVEVAFQRKDREASEQISSWGNELRRRAKKDYQDYLKSLTRQEPCAYPSCPNTVEVHKGGTELEEDEHPQPVRSITITYEIAGWHWEGGTYGGKNRVKNTETCMRKLYTCSKKHEEGIFRLRVGVALTLDEQEEEQLQRLRYPIDASQEALWEVIDLAQNTALDLVAQTDEQDLVQTKAQMKTHATQHLTLLLQSSDMQTLTDNLDRLKKVYIQQFVFGYRNGLAIRASILDKGSESYVSQQRWSVVYEHRERRRNELL